MDPQTFANRSPMEAGSPEFAEDRTQINSLNNKRIHEEYQDLALTAARRSQVNFDNLQQISTRSLNQSVELQAQLNKLVATGFSQNAVDLAAINAQKIRHADMWAYEQAYDLGNPVTTGTGDAVRAAAYTPNRSVDTASAGVGVAAEAVAAAVAKQVDATITPVVAALQQLIETLATTNASIANVLAQSQPKAAA
jgi:Zn-dependent alcohol dehydrogenase